MISGIGGSFQSMAALWNKASRPDTSQMAQELFLNGVRAVPERLTRLGFAFRFPTLTAALDDILGGSDPVHA